MQPQMVTVLTDTALRGEDLDEARTLEAKQHAEELLQTQPANIETAKAMTELAEVAAQLRMIQRLRQSGR